MQPSLATSHPCLRRSVPGWLLVGALLGLASLGPLRTGAQPAPAPLPPTELPGLRDSRPFFPGTTYRASIPTPDALLGFPAAERAATSAEIERCLRAWTNAAPDRTRLVEYARSHEGRPLHYLVIATPERIARLDALQADLARLGDPRSVTPADAAQLVDRLPGVAWLAYTIHGDETEGSDAALSVIHHLLAAEDPATARILDRLVVVVDPVMNPDGRDRFLKMIAENRGVHPSVDDQALPHSGYWPAGRGNHYLFDLNRDWIFGRHPETRGRIREVARWLPVLLVDAHGMGAHETHLFSPPREPIHPHVPRHRRVWSEIFAADQAAAFDARGLVYYSGEWNDEWYPGYSDSWATYRGAVGILYEQARIATDGVRRAEGHILSYRESVLHHVLGSIANLETAARESKALLAGLHATRREAIDPEGPYGRRTFAVLPTANRSRFEDLARLLALQGFELHTNAAAIRLPAATNQLGETLADVVLPPGTLLIPNRQPLAHLLSAMLEFDSRLPERALEEERREVLRTGSGRSYDITAWNLTMLFGLPSLTLPNDLPEGTSPWRNPDPAAPPATAPNPAAGARPPVAWVFDGDDDRSVTAAARLLERGARVRASNKSFTFENRLFARGSIVVTRLDNRSFTGDLAATLETTSRELGFPAVPAFSGLGPGELPDLGGGHFIRLEPPRIAILGRDGASPAEFGSVWFSIDHGLGVRNSVIAPSSTPDLARYNVLVIPDRTSGDFDRMAPALRDWVSQGGTLIAAGAAAASPFLSEKADFGHSRDLSEVLTRLPEFELAVLREWHARTGPIPPLEGVWSHLTPDRIEYPWEVQKGGHPDEKELRRRDAWQSLFMPSGALLATRIDTNHWLTAGCPEPLPILAAGRLVLMAGEGVDAPIRLGHLSPTSSPPAAVTATATATASTSAPPATASATNASPPPASPPPSADAASGTNATAVAKSDTSAKKADEPGRPGWSAHPPGTRMHLRMSGLLWPEATHRLAHSAWVTRESLGRGQIILFASPPTFRGASPGTTRVFYNAVVLGPGFGTSPVIRP